MALVSAQLINYSSLGGTDFGGWKAVAGPLAASSDSAAEQQAAWAERLRLLHSCFQLEAGQFDGSYKADIVAKYVAASAEAVAAAAAAARGESNGSKGASGAAVSAKSTKKKKPTAAAAAKPKVSTAANRGGLSMEAGSDDDGDSSDFGDEAFEGVDDNVDSDAEGTAAAAGQGDDEDADGDEDGSEEETGGFFGGAHAEGWDAKEEDDVLDEALDALLEAEREGEGEAYVNRFTDDFDVLAAQEALKRTATAGKGGGGAKKKQRRKK